MYKCVSVIVMISAFVLPSVSSSNNHWNWQSQDYAPYYYPDESYPYPDPIAYPYPADGGYYNYPYPEEHNLYPPQYAGQFMLYHTIYPQSSPDYPYSPHMTRIEQIRRRKMMEMKAMIANPFLSKRTIGGIEIPGYGDIYDQLVSKKK